MSAAAEDHHSSAAQDVADDCSANDEQLLLEVVQSGQAWIAWSRFGEEPWWPSLAMTSWDTLRLFITPGEQDPMGEVEKGRLLVYFLGQQSYEVVDKGHVTKHYYDRKPNAKELAVNDDYKVAVLQCQRLVSALEATEKPDNDKLLQALKNGDALLVYAFTEATWWPAVSFTSWEAAEKTGAEISLDRRALKEDYKIVFRLGGLPNPWQVVKRSVEFLAKRIQKNTSSTLDKSYSVSPGTARSMMYDTAVAEAESLYQVVTGRGGGGGGGKGKSDGLRGGGSAKRDSDAEWGDDAKTTASKKVKKEGAEAASKKRGRKGREGDDGKEAGGKGPLTEALPWKYSNRVRKRKKLTPEEVRKIRRLAEGLMYMAAVQDTPTLMADLTELRDSLSQSRRGRIDKETLERLEEGLSCYVKKMRQQLADGERSFRRYKTQVEEAATEYQNVCMALSKDLGKVMATMTDQREKLAQQVRNWSCKKGFSMAIKEEGKTLERIVTVTQALDDLRPLLKEPKNVKQRMTDSLVDHAQVAYRIGEDLTGDQIAAANQLLRTCADFQARLTKDPHDAFF